MPETWIVEHADGGPRGHFAALEVAGRPIRDLVQMVVMQLADAQHGQGEAAAQWDAYTTARLNYDSAETFGPDDDTTMAELETAETIALDELITQVAQTIRIPMREVQPLADLLTQRAAERVGTERRTAA